jgi:hypothetical protein
MNATSKSSDLPPSILTAKSRTAATVLPDDAELEAQNEPVAAPAEVGGTKALTVKVDMPRYKRMQMARIKRDKTTQTILSEALDLWFKKYDRPAP